MSFHIRDHPEEQRTVCVDAIVFFYECSTFAHHSAVLKKDIIYKSHSNVQLNNMHRCKKALNLYRQSTAL